jgi:hypothetical protein
MREALEELESILSTWIDYLPPVIQEKAREAHYRANAVLDEPLLNCEVGTKLEQRDRFNEFCRSNGKCLPDGDKCSKCLMKWERMQYKEVK